MEEWDLLNENCELIGKIYICGEKLVFGEFYLVVYVCIFNEKG